MYARIKFINGTSIRIPEAPAPGAQRIDTSIRIRAEGSFLFIDDLTWNTTQAFHADSIESAETRHVDDDEDGAPLAARPAAGH